MPLYDYECPACGNEKEVQHSMSEIGRINVLCETCGEKMKKRLSVPSLVGFDEVGRSIGKKDKTKNSDKEGKGDSGSSNSQPSSAFWTRVARSGGHGRSTRLHLMCRLTDRSTALTKPTCLGPARDRAISTASFTMEYTGV